MGIISIRVTALHLFITVLPYSMLICFHLRISDQNIYNIRIAWKILLGHDESQYFY